MLGGAYLCYEGAEKVFEAVLPARGARARGRARHRSRIDPKALEDEKVASAIKTDFILSAEIMAITLAGCRTSILDAGRGAGGRRRRHHRRGLWRRRADREGRRCRRGAGGEPERSDLGGIGRAVGRGLVLGMPYFLKALSIVGTAAMIWVGGGIIVHGLETYGYTSIGHAIHDVAELAAHAVPVAQAAIEWIVGAAGAGVVGLVVGAILIPVTGYAITPLWKAAKRVIRTVRPA